MVLGVWREDDNNVVESLKCLATRSLRRMTSSHTIGVLTSTTANYMNFEPMGIGFKWFFGIAPPGPPGLVVV